MGLAMGLAWTVELEASTEAQPEDYSPVKYAVDNLVAIL